MKTDNKLQKILLAAALALPFAVAAADDATVMPAPGGYGAYGGIEADAPPPGMEGGASGMPHRPGPGMQGGMPGPGRHPGAMGTMAPQGGPAPFGPLPGGPGTMAPPFLHGLELTEAQQDKIFAIMYGQAPYLRDQGKALHKAHEALRTLAQSAQYDDARAAALAQAAAQAMSNLELARVRTDQKVLAVLTAEQRRQVEQRMAAMPQRGPRS
jgi:Spy/CpxP family protein refolding chaperone